MSVPKDPEKYKLFIEKSKLSHKGHVPWNKGKPMPEEQKQKLRDYRLGKHYSLSTKQKMSISQKEIHKNQEYLNKISKSLKGKKKTPEHCKKISASLKGKPLTEETKRKLSIAHKGKKMSEITKKKVVAALLGRVVSEETRKKIRDAQKGKRCGADSVAWKGGIGYLPYCYKFNTTRKNAVRTYFNNLCICTGEPQYNRELCVHHIDHDKEQGCNGKPFNLVPMCDSHHSKELHHEEEYKAYINKTLREGFKWGIWNEQEYKEKVMYE